MAEQNIILDKSFQFAIRIVNCCKFLQNNHNEYVLSKQLLRSGTAIGALVKEAIQGESRKDFIHKMSIALKEANETEYWIMLLHETGYLDRKTFTSMMRKTPNIF